MYKFRSYIHSLLLVTYPALLAYPQSGHCSQQISFQELPFADVNLTYDDALRLIRDIEGGRIDNLPEDELNKIERFIAYLAKIGLTPGDTLAENDLDHDIYALFDDKDDYYDFTQYCPSPYAYTALPMLVKGGQNEIAFLVKKHKEDKKHKKDKKKKNKLNDKEEQEKHNKGISSKIKQFVVKHKKKIIIGAAILVATFAVIAAVRAQLAAAAAKSATAVRASDKKDKTESSSSPPPDPPDISPEMAKAISDQIFTFKEKIAQSQFLDSANLSSQKGVSMEENCSNNEIR